MEFNSKGLRKTIGSGWLVPICLAVAVSLYVQGLVFSPEAKPPGSPTLSGSPAVLDQSTEISNPAFYPFRIYDARPPEEKIPTLQQLAGGVPSDADIVKKVVKYYHAHRARLQMRWQETNPDRLAAFFAMNVVHVSHPYGTSRQPLSFLDYLQNTKFSSCRTYSVYQSRILDALGLQWRYVAISSGAHGWLEVRVGNRWEIFDSTANVWIDQSAFDLLKGKERRYWAFYSPWTDRDQPAARVSILGQSEPHLHSPGSLRAYMPGLGIYYMGETFREAHGLRIEIWDHFDPPPPHTTRAENIH